MAENKPLLDSAINKWSFGDEGLTSSVIHKERINYDQVVFPGLLVNNFFDFWGKDRFYGRINLQGSPVYARESYLKQLRYADDKNPHFAVNFVADAWRDFCDKVRDLKNRNILKDSGPYSDMKVYKSWRSPAVEYHNYMTNVLFPVFSNIFMSLRERERAVKDFGTFLSVFTDFSDTVLRDVGPLTYSGFLESGIVSPFSSGLVIEISTDNHNDDFNKLKTFFYDENFPLIQALCTQYGFAIDKNAPWRFVADIGNLATQEYIFGLPLAGEDPLNVNDLTDCEEPIINDDLNQTEEPYAYSRVFGLENVRRYSPGYVPYRLAPGAGVSPNSFEAVFSTAYRDPFELDVPFLQAYLLDFYSRHILKKPYYEDQPSYQNFCNPGHPVLKLRPEHDISVYNVYSNKWALKTYYILRCEEKRLYKDTDQKTKDFRRISSIYDLLAGSPEEKFSGTLRYIRESILVEKENKTKKTIY